MLRQPLHDRIRHDVERRIMSGEWAPGYRIPFEHELVEQYGCSRMTVNKAMTELVRRGLIERRRKSGSYVMFPHARSAVLEIRDIESEVAALGLPYSYQCLQRVRRKASSADRHLLELQDQEDVIYLRILHFAGRKPFCIEERLISVSAVPDVATENFEQTPPGRWLISRVPWSAAEHKIRAVGASAQTAHLLGLKNGAPCLVIERRTWNNGKYITHVSLIYSGDSHELVGQFAPAHS